MLRKIRRRFGSMSQSKRSVAKMAAAEKAAERSALRLEDLESRVLLDTAGWWDELGWSSASGGGATWDMQADNSEAELVLSGDGDPVLVWVEGQIEEFVNIPVPFHFQMSGDIYAREYSGSSLSWQDLAPGMDGQLLSAINFTQYYGAEATAVDTACTARKVDCRDIDGAGNLVEGFNASQISAAAGPNGMIVVAWVAEATPTEVPTDGREGLDSEIYVKMWNGSAWVELDNPPVPREIIGSGSSMVILDLENSARGGGLSNDGAAINEHPSVAISESGEIFVSYTAVHPNTGQREIVVKKYGYDYSGRTQTNQAGPPRPTDLKWVELVSSEVGDFASDAYQQTGGVSNDLANSYDSAIALDNEGYPIVAWTDASWEGNTEIFVKQWDGGDWVELGTGSASDPDSDGNYGVSSNATQSLQPDIAVASDGDVVVTWVDWANWPNYDSSGKAGIFVKVLHNNSSAWEAYAAGSASGAGIAVDSGLPATTDGGAAPGQGWYYSPDISLDSNDNPLITWQGYGEDDKANGYMANRDSADDAESPIMTVYTSYYNGISFGLLYENGDLRGDAGEQTYPFGWMPEALVGPNDELIMAYTWHDVYADNVHTDDEIFVQAWDAVNSLWEPYGRGGNSNGNDVIGGFPGDNDNAQLGLIDYTTNPNDELDVIAAIPGTAATNSGHIYLYRRDTGAWTDEIDTVSFGSVFDLKGDPSVEFGIAGAPLLAYIDDISGLPYVYRFVAGAWTRVGSGSADDGSHDPTGDADSISVQAGPNGTILLAYLWNDGQDDQVVTRLWNPVVGSWANADSSQATIPLHPSLAPVYYANYDGFDWDDYGDLKDGEYTIYGARIYTLGDWNFWDATDYGTIASLGTDYTPADLVTGSVSDEAGWAWLDTSVYPAEWREDGVLMEFVIGEDEQVSGFIGSEIVGQVDHQFQLMANDHVVIELAYALDALESVNMDLTLQLLIDNVVVDTNIGSVHHGEELNYSSTTTLTIDSDLLDLETTSLAGGVDATVDAVTGKLFAGFHTVGIQAVATVGVIPDLESDFEVAVTDVDDPNYPNNGWVSEPDPAGDGTSFDGRTLGVGNGAAGLKFTIGDGAAVTEEEKEFALGASYDFVGGGDIGVGLYYSIDMTGVFVGDDTFSLYAILDGDEENGVEIVGPIVADDLDKTIALSVLFAGVDAGEHTLTINGVLTLHTNPGVTAVAEVVLDDIIISRTQVGEEQTLRAMMDNFAVYQRIVPVSSTDTGSPGLFDFDSGMAGWTYLDVTEPVNGVLDANGGAGGAGDGALVMTIGAAGLSVENMVGVFYYDNIDLAADSYLTLDFDYYLDAESTVGAGETVDLLVMLNGVFINATGVYQVTGDGTSTVSSGWVSVSNLDLGFLPAGNNYELWIAGGMSNYTGANKADAVGHVKLDNVDINYYASYGTWEFLPAGGGTGDTGSNETVGRNPDGSAIYNFQADLHSVLLNTIGSQSYVINDVIQGATGDMVVSFRYRHVDNAFISGIEVFIDGVEYGSDALTGYLPVIAYADDEDWYNGNPDAPAYTYAQVTANDVAAGECDIEIRLTSTAATTADLWIDNVFVLASQPTDALKPLATLTATGSGSVREFAVGVTGVSPNLSLYGDSSVYPSGLVNDFTFYSMVGDGNYYFCEIYTLDEDDGWEVYGSKIASTVTINYLGVGAGYAMPSGHDLYMLEDLAIGTDQWEWVAMQHFSTDWVDTDDDGVNDRFDIHPWDYSDPLSYWTIAYTELDVYVWKWVSASNPLGGSTGWLDTGFVANKIFDESDQVDDSGHGVFRAYTNPQLVSSSGQYLTAAWTRRGTNGNHSQSAAMRYEGGNTWGVLGNSEDIQNGQFWSALWLEDMTITANNEPITSYYMGHLDCLGLRQFRTESTLPSMAVTESLGQDSDNTDGVLDLGETTTTWLNGSITVSNSGPADLIIYDMELGGFGDYDSAFSLLNAPAFPFVLEKDQQRSFTVRFDPSGVPAGVYAGSLIIHNNSTENAANAANAEHPNPSFYDVAVQAEVLSRGEIDIALSDQWLVFDDQVINTTSDGQEVVIYNKGQGDLIIHEWLFDNPAYSVSSAVVHWLDNDGVEQSRTVSTENGVGSSDDVVLASHYTAQAGSVHNEYLTLLVVFTPTEVAGYEQTLYVHSSDSNESIIPVRLSGVGLSGADIEIKANSIVIPNTNGQIDFGSVIKGTSSDPVTVVIYNVGSTDLTIDEITGTTLYSEITTNPPVEEISGEVIAVGGIPYSFTITYTPNIGQAGDTSIDKLEAYLTIVSDSAGAGSSSITVALVGLGVPADVPMIKLVDPDTGQAIDSLDFGTTYIGTSVWKTFWVANTGGMDLTLERYYLTGTSGIYTIDPENAPNDDTDNVVIAYGDDPVLITVTFTPTSVGGASDQLQIYYLNAAGTAIFTNGTRTSLVNSVLDLMGAATGQALTVTDSQGNPNDRLIDFGNIGKGQTAGVQTVTLKNSGNSSLTITGWTLAGDSAFSADEFTSQFTLGPGVTRVIAVEFTPAEVASYGATLTVTSDDPNSPFWVVTLAGDGVAPGISGVSPLSLDFGTLVLNTNKKMSFTVSNTGSSTLRVTGIEITNNSKFFVVSPAPDKDNPNDDLDIAAGGSQDFQVVFYAVNPFNSTTMAEDLAIVVYTNDLSGGGDAATEIALIAKTQYATDIGGSSGSKISWTDDNGNIVQIKLTGGGTATVYAVSASNNDIGIIELSNTTARSSLTITGPKGGTSIGGIVGSTLRNVTLKNVTLDGDQDDDGIEDRDNAIELDYLAGTLTLGDVLDGADIYIGAASSRGAKIKAGTIGDGTDIVVNGNVSNFQAGGFGGGNFSADDVSMFKIGSGDFGAVVRLSGSLKTANLASKDVSGSFIVDGDITTLNAGRAEFTGAINAGSIRSLNFDDMTGAAVSVRVKLKTLRVADDMIDTLILAGFDLGNDGRPGGGDDDLVSGGQISSVNVGGSFSDSYVIAGLSTNANGDFEIFGANPSVESLSGSIGKVRFNSVDKNNDDVGFGIAAHSGIQLVQVGSRRIDDSDLPYIDDDFNVRLF